MSETEADAKDEMMNRFDETGSTENAMGEVDQQANDAKELGGGNLEEEREGQQMEIVGDVKGRRSSKEMLEHTPSFSPDRPVRERKAVVRLVEIIEKERDEGFHIEKGCGTPLKDIPNVACRLSKTKLEDLKLLHTILFGRKGKAADFKNHILRFSGFVWHENEEKQRTKIQEKLDKCTKEQLLDLCDVFDISVSSISERKENLVVGLLDFMAAPHATSDILLSESNQHLTSLFKRKRSSRTMPSGSPAKHHRKRCKKGEDASALTEKETSEIEEEDSYERGAEENKESHISNGHEDAQHSVSEKENELNDIADEGALKAGKTMKGKKEVISKAAKKSSSKKNSDSADKLSETTSKYLKSKETGITGNKVFSRRKKVVTVSKKKLSSPRSHTSTKNTGKKLGKTKAKSGNIEDSSPSNEEVWKLISQILKDVDFNTATFKDILRQLGSHCKKDLTPRKEEIKSIVKEQLTKIAEAEVDEEDAEDEGDDGIDENAQFGGKGFQT